MRAGGSLKNVEPNKPVISPLGHARQNGKNILGDEARANSKSRVELQMVIAAVRTREFPAAVQL